MEKPYCNCKAADESSPRPPRPDSSAFDPIEQALDAADQLEGGEAPLECISWPMAQMWTITHCAGPNHLGVAVKFRRRRGDADDRAGRGGVRRALRRIRRGRFRSGRDTNAKANAVLHRQPTPFFTIVLPTTAILPPANAVFHRQPLPTFGHQPGELDEEEGKSYLLAAEVDPAELDNAWCRSHRPLFPVVRCLFPVVPRLFTASFHCLFPVITALSLLFLVVPRRLFTAFP